ncbi:hypothetical protein [Mycolicibacterium sp.]|uniref:hypothetical protein n=1 Tax=Mycolicibacterium sp. TaxID=2320850 RepID=UPI001DE13FB9|nr:hypothetical protein [Mycolicibacterium sp.]MCB1291672.1 hypothetical protein [Mycobacterium sp.]MCB9410768.1 hypothetical protein [Mycolicibacterium sp.]
MRVANTVFFFPWWALVLLAVLPPALAAAAAFPIRRLIPDSEAVVDARTKLVLLGISAYTFTVGFSVNTLWYQDIELNDAALAFDFRVSLLKDAAQDHAAALPADIDGKIDALRQPEVVADAVSVLPRQNAAFSRAWDELNLAWADAPAAALADLKTHADEAELAFYKLAQSANSPGVPGIILVVIVLLGMLLAGTMVAAPRTAGNSRKENAAIDWLMVAGVAIISLTQWALWVLNSRDFVLSMILPNFAGEVRSLTALQFSVFGAVVLAPLLGVAVLLRFSSRRSTQDDVAAHD